MSDHKDWHRCQEVHLAECAINNEADSIGDPQADPDGV